MKYVKQFAIILLVSLVGEALSALVPLPVPGSVYGIVILFFLLLSGVVKLSAVSETGHFLIEIMPLMFVSPAVGLLESWGLVKDSILQYLVITIVTTVMVMGIAGRVTQSVVRKGGKHA